jgi:putative intracellular protease/amidase
MPNKRILIVLTEWGYWGEELIGPLKTFDAAGYESTFLTATGLRPVALPVSMDPAFVDPPLGKVVVSQEMAAKVAKIEDPKNPRLSAPINLRDWFPENPYPSAPDYLRRREHYFNVLQDRKQEIANRFDTILLVGGGGATIDMANNYRLKDLVRCFYELSKPIAAECYGVTCLAFTYISEDDSRPIIWGKHVTGHPRPYDYEIGSSFWWRDMRDEGGQKVGGYLDTEFPTIPLQLVLECAVGPEGRFHGNVGKEISVIVDYPFITGRSTPDSYATGQQLKNVLEDPNYRRYGW